MYYSISTEANYYTNSTDAINYYNGYDYGHQYYKTATNSCQLYNSNSNESYTNNIYVEVPKKAGKRTSRTSYEMAKRIKEENDISPCQETKYSNQICMSPMTNSSNSASSTTTSEDLYCESLYKAYQSGAISKSRYKRLIANERERKRMHGLNVAFENLRSVLPNLGSNKQFSKYETLQMAKSYISALRDILLSETSTTYAQYYAYEKTFKN